jgi:hypothetical protein
MTHPLLEDEDPVTLPRTEFDRLTDQQKHDFMKRGGRLVGDEEVSRPLRGKEEVREDAPFYDTDE